MNEPTTPSTPAPPEPQRGGSYIRHPETHELTRVEPAPEYTPASSDPGEAVSASPATAATAGQA